jgi:pilus assembly protein CpaF
LSKQKGKKKNLLRKNNTETSKNLYESKCIDIQKIIELVNREFNGILRENLYEIALSDNELTKVKGRKRELRNALKNCSIGDVYSKNYIKGAIIDILTDKMNILEDDICNIIDFKNIGRLSVKDKFDIILYMYKKRYDKDGFLKLVSEYNLARPIIEKSGIKYEINEEDIEDIFAQKYVGLNFKDKLNIFAQRIYELYLGLGVIDELRDMNIDGISGGVSGKNGTYKSIWVFIEGKTVHLSFLDFQTNRELERICLNIYRYNNPGQLSMTKGYIVNEMKDNSRVVVVRPPFSESFAFFVRKFDNIKHKCLKELLIDNNSDELIEVLKWLVKGCQVCGITGAQGCGKTTLLMALIDYIPPAFALRIQEMSFELHLREVYPDRNILTFRETDYISGQEGLDLQKKTDGVVNILGEVATAPVAAWLVQMGMVASLFTMFTHHAKTTDSLIKYLRNSLLTQGGFTNEIIAQEQVVDVIRFDIHMEKDIYGHRYIERVTEIVPKDNGYELVNIVEFNNGKYVRKCGFSEKTFNDILKHLTEEEGVEFLERFCI